ncbi:major facilitator superfamily transporter protein [Loa loa]|nr:major facilitator superfamily transporter protein [Loa loa]EJD73887.1 major facilitator superfamily transporter protein [Loa loa]
MKEGINGSERITSQPCLPNVASEIEMKMLINDKSYSRLNTNDNQDYIEIRSCHVDERLNWTMLEQGMVLCAQNIGSLFMLIIGPQADRLNGKWTVAVALFVTIISNMMLPIFAAKHFIFAIIARILCGIADAFLTPSISSMIVRWFPPKERSFAIGFITGGRQIGSLLILPISGWVCLKKDTFGSWKFTFYISAIIATLMLFVWLIMSADKPSKHYCVKKEEKMYILRKISEESLGKRKERRNTPWKQLLISRPFIAGILAVVCQEYPLVITTTLLPIYMKEVLHLSDVRSTLYSALPLLALWMSKNLSSSLSSYLSARKKGCRLVDRTILVKSFNGIGSAGLAIGLFMIPLLTHSVPALIVVCAANAFAGLHTPGVFTALLQIGPAYTGSITGIAFSAGHIANIVNKLTNGLILHSWSGSAGQWKLLYTISAIVAFLPVIFFTLWGSADLQPWAIPKLKKSSGSGKKDGNIDSKDSEMISSATYLAETLPTSV